MGKARVTPLKFVSIPRLELVAAVLAVRILALLKRELGIQVDEEYFWTDSKVVLGYIKNESRAFKTFVANRVQIIQENSKVNQWNYIESKSNPADIASRGMNSKKLTCFDTWFQGPEFLWKPQSTWLNSSIQEMILDLKEDLEWRKQIKINVTSANEDFISNMEIRFSCWQKLKRIIAYILKWKTIHMQEKRMVTRGSKRVNMFSTNKNFSLLDINQIQQAEECIIKMIQLKYFKEEIKILKMKEETSDAREVKDSSDIAKLDPFLDERDLIRVGGRLARSNLNDECKHPIVLPKGSHISKLIIVWCHKKTGHAGRGMTLNELRHSGFWIVSANSLVRSVIYHCVSCRKLRGRFAEQKMAELPFDRLQEAPPFTYCGVDLFGPFIITNKRKELKRYGVMFTCLCSRVIHTEVAYSLETDSFIFALRRFIGRRGNIRQMRSDNGSNFVGAVRELRKSFKEMNHNQISKYLHSCGADWITWINNPPTASHMGGVWERQI